MPRIDLNCDMGESFGAWHMGNDEAVLDYVNSANVACGFHAGDPKTMHATVKAAFDRGVAVGALAAFAQALGGKLSHVKAHGMFYNMAAKDATLAEAIAQAVRDFDRELVLFGLAGSELVRAAEKAGLRAASEVFADRSYQDDGSLTPRSHPGAMIEDVEVSVAQVKRMVFEGVVRSVSGKDVPVKADTLCIHGDQPGALEFVRRIREDLAREGVSVRSFAADR